MQNILCHTVIQDHIFKGSSFKCRSWSNLQCQTVVSNIILHAISGLILQTNLTKMPFLYLLKQKKKKPEKKTLCNCNTEINQTDLDCDFLSSINEKST